MSFINKVRIAALSALIFGLTATPAVHAGTLTGTGCNQAGVISYAFVNPGASLLLMDNGTTCIVYGLTADEATALATVASEGVASGKKVLVKIGSDGSVGNNPTALSLGITKY